MEAEEGSTDSFPIEMLPSDLAELVAQFLTVKDLIACCAVSVRMRDLFGDDIVWKSRCDKEQAEYLRITPCRVKPGFVSPEVEGSTLSPVSQWRMAFMRENHLWNNWRQSNRTYHMIKNQDSDISGHESICHIFSSNDHIIGVFKNRFELLDVRKYPAAHVIEPIQIIPNLSHICFASDAVWLVEGDLIIIHFRSAVYVYQLDVINKHCCLKHVFYFEELQKLPVDDPIKLKKKSYTEESYRDHGAVRNVAGNTFVGAIKGKSTFHIWNLATGIKLKEEECLLRKSSCKIKDLQVSQNLNLVLAVKVEDATDSITFLAYSLTEFSYFPFEVSVNGLCEYNVINDFVGLWNNRAIHFYNYQTSELLLVHSAQYRPRIFKGNFVFIVEGLGTLKRFDPATQLLETLPMEDVRWFGGLHDRFLEVGKDRNNIEIWEVQGMFKNVKKTSIKFHFHACGFILNKAFTRYIVRDGDVGKVIHRW